MSKIPHLLKNAGFKKLNTSSSMNIRFGLLKIYELDGFFFDDDQDLMQSQIVDFSNQCQIVISQSAKKATENLTGSEILEIDEDLLIDSKVTPPFLLIYFRESQIRSFKDGIGKIDNDIIYLHNAFPNGKKEIRDWINNDLPTIITSLVYEFSNQNRLVDFTPVYENIFGLTDENKIVYDIKLSARVELKQGKKFKISEINTRLGASKKTSSFFKRIGCRNFYAALIEPDSIRKFLGFFHFIERHTLKTFKRIVKSNTYSEKIDSTFEKPDRLKESSSNYFEKILEDSRFLSHKFFWCATLEWKNIDDSDISAFKKLKKIRDDYSHGSEINEDKLPIDEAKNLAIKLLDSTTKTQLNSN